MLLKARLTRSQKGINTAWTRWVAPLLLLSSGALMRTGADQKKGRTSQRTFVKIAKEYIGEGTEKIAWSGRVSQLVVAGRFQSFQACTL